jgi:glyoxylase-like metal-dependent hydrolase (beta-lactamase superfamily II)
MKPQILEVSDRVLCVRRRSYLTCSYLVRTADGVVAVDGGMDSSGADVWAGLAAMGERRDAIRALLVTHWHNDHAAGVAAVHAATAAPVYYHLREEPFLTRRTARLGLRGWLSEVIPEWGVLVLFKGLLGEAPPRAVAADHHVAEGERILDGFTVYETPGHTPGQVAYFHEPSGALFCGDALAVIDDRIRFMARPVTLDLAAARASMAKLLSLDVRYLCPGHRQPLTRDVGAECRRMARRLRQDGSWPLFG